MKKNKTEQLEFELAYLARLTRAGIKPLSRWEKTLTPNQVEALESLKLKVAHVSRRLDTGDICTESVFSHSEGSIDLYLSAFEGKPVRKNPVHRRMEGMLFGFPSCCIEHYIVHGYAPNDLESHEQELLFHWACPHCELTRKLLPLYRQTFESCKKMQHIPERARSNRSFLKQTCAAVTALSVLVSGAALLMPPAVQSAPRDIDLHHLDLPDDMDQDQDFLNDNYEVICGTEPGNPDTDDNGKLDGIQLAQHLAAVLDSLPHTPQKNRPYINDFELRGLETCSICQETVNMGYAQIVNPLEHLSIETPYLSLHHFLSHGSFAYEGDVHGKGYVNAGLLCKVAAGRGGSHITIVEPDADADGLPDSEEMFWGNDLQNPDTDNNGKPDGEQLALRYAQEINSLGRNASHDSVYVEEYKMRGVVMCPHCGQSVNMGYMQVINPLRKDSLRVSYLQHHFFSCGSFNSPGEADSLLTPHRLRDILSTASDLHHLPVIPDADKDGLTDEEESQLGRMIYDPDENMNGVPDGADLAADLAAQLNALPDSGSGVYVTHHEMWGLETCHICGETFNMGYLQVAHPADETLVDIPYIGLHYMQHGSFSYHGTVNSGRVSLSDLVSLLSLNTSVEDDKTQTSQAFTLKPAFPNPFNLAVSIPFSVQTEQSVRIRILSATGQCIRELANSRRSGDQRLEWDGTDEQSRSVPSGTYIISYRVGNQRRYQTVTLIK
ncbi:MAG: hypothetical protein U5R06_10180 [candidate division KSB1 bacterium]|nr:hypothetical protein [candidate division KSB1 bacterium]